MMYPGARPIKKDRRDFKLSDIQLGGLGISLIPDFSFAGKIKNQFLSDFCTAFAVTSASEIQEGVELSPEYQFAKTKQLLGEYKKWGADLRTAIKSALKFGSLNIKEVSSEMKIAERDTIANWKNWDGALDVLAEQHKKKSYFSVNNSFEAIIIAMYDNREVVLTGANWRQEWTSAKKGIIPLNYGNYGVGHAFILTGKKTINDKVYIEAQHSGGESVGDKGLFYFSKEIIEKEIGKYGVFILVDYPDGMYKEIHWTFWTKVYDFIIKFLKK